MPGELTDVEKRHWLWVKYFGTTDQPSDDVNPYQSINGFLKATVGKLRWGLDPEVRRRSKERFADTFHEVLKLYDVQLAKEDIVKAITDDNRTNRDVVEIWVRSAEFPAKP